MFTARAGKLLANRHQDDRVYNDNSLLFDGSPQQVQRIKRLVHLTFPHCHVKVVHSVNHKQMYGMYLLRKEEMQLETLKRPGSTNQVRELTLFHVTTEKNAFKSLENGLDWRRTRRSKFGRGVSFSDDVDYADFYANNSSGEQKRVIFVCTVLVALEWNVKSNVGYNLHIPPGRADTTVSQNGRVYVKYYDFEFYPLHMVYYLRRPEDLNKSRFFNPNKNKKNQNQPENKTELQVQRQRKDHQWSNNQLEEQRRKELQQQQWYQLQQIRQIEREVREVREERFAAKRYQRQSQQQQNNGCLIL